ncbi:MAG: PAS domain S-box protein [Desulfuromonadaceae bacterium]|nr:PAS domain S-box protein [Desulfuromonadaceae bacterium]
MHALTTSRLRKQLTLFFMASILFLGAVITASTGSRLLAIFKSSVHSNLIKQVENKQLAIENYLHRLADLSLQLGSRSGLRDLLASYDQGLVPLETLQQFSTPRLRDATQRLHELSGLILLTADGQEAAHIGVIPDRDLWPAIPGPEDPKQYGHYGVVFSPPFYLDGKLYLIVISPIYHQQRLIGHDLLCFCPEHLQSVFEEKSDLYSGTPFLFRGGSTTPILINGAELSPPGGLDPKSNPHLLESLHSLSGSGGIYPYPAMDGQPPTLLACSRLYDLGWYIGVLHNRAELDSYLKKKLQPVFLIILAVTALGGIIFYFLARPLARQVLVHATDLEQMNQDLAKEVSERRQIEQHLLTSEQEWANTFESIDDAISILDREGRIHKQNRAARQLSGSYSAVHRKRADLRNLLPEDGQPSELFQQLLAEGKPVESIYSDEITGAFFRISLTPLSVHNALRGVVQIVQDITEQKQIEKMKSEMISAVSHEIRTPLTAITGFVEFMLENETSADQRQNYLEIIHREMRRLNELMNDFLDLQRLQLSLHAYHFAPTDTLALLKETLSLFEMASEKHQLVSQLPDQLPELSLDANRMQQVLKNILANAIKYSPAGGTIRVNARSTDQSVFIWVQDEGIGIPVKDQQKIFSRFYRVDDSDRRIPGGLGLGLALVDEIVKAHQGRVWVESTLEKGSTFFIELPRHPEREPQDAAQRI